MVGAVMIFHDSTDRVLAERRLQQTHDELQQKNHEMEQFTHTVSHDLKTPLVTIQGFSSQLRRDLGESRLDRLPDFVNRIQNATERMKSLIDGLLDLSRIGRLVAPSETVDISKLVGQLVEQHREEILAEGAVVDVQPDMPAVYGDPVRIAQVFENLLANAIRYGRGPDSLQIRIGSERHGEETRFFVRDNGPGVAPEYHEQIFQLFERLNRKTEGTGVGLAIVRRVAELHGGKAWVESSPGHGATFWVSFHDRAGLDRAAASEAGATEGTADPVTDEPARIKGLHAHAVALPCHGSAIRREDVPSLVTPPTQETMK